MARGFVRKNNLTKDTLLRIAVLGVVLIAVSTSPFFLNNLVRSYFKDRTLKGQRMRAKKLRKLEKKKLISFKELGDGKVRIELSIRGKALVREYDLENMKLVKPKRWDELWRVVIYDIPTSQKKASNAFREKIRNLGLFQLQRSVWVSPYECLAEIEFIASIFEIDINKCICYFTTRDIPHRKEIEKHFSF